MIEEEVIKKDHHSSIHLPLLHPRIFGHFLIVLACNLLLKIERFIDCLIRCNLLERKRSVENNEKGFTMESLK
jgi:hypothetical protein